MILCGRQMPPPAFLFNLLAEWTLKSVDDGKTNFQALTC